MSIEKGGLKIVKGFSTETKKDKEPERVKVNEYRGIGVSPRNRIDMIQQADEIESFVRREFHGRFTPSYKDKVAAKKLYKDKDEHYLLHVARNSDNSDWRRFTTQYLELAKALRKKAAEDSGYQIPDQTT